MGIVGSEKVGAAGLGILSRKKGGITDLGIMGSKKGEQQVWKLWQEKGGAACLGKI